MQRTLPSGRPAFSLVEMLISTGISLVIGGVLTFVYVNDSVATDKGQRTLELLRQAAILIEHVRQDVRSAIAGRDGVLIDGERVTIRRHARGAIVTVTYVFDPAECRVVRRDPDGATTFGGDPRIAQFSVRAVASLPGFYRVDARFETPVTAPRAFRALVSKRAVEPSAADPRWRPGYPE